MVVPDHPLYWVPSSSVADASALCFTVINPLLLLPTVRLIVMMVVLRLDFHTL